MSFSIVIPVYGQAALLHQCLSSLMETIDTSVVEVLLYDDHTPGEEAAEVQEVADLFYPMGVKFTRQLQNKGFAANCNDGIEAASNDRVVLLNQDTVMAEGWTVMLRWLDYESIGVVGNLQLNRQGKVDHLGVAPHRYGPTMVPIHLYRTIPLKAIPDCALQPKTVPAVTGACMAFDRSKIGSRPLDEIFRNGYEDIDLCYRVRVNMGLRVVIDPESRITHVGSQSEGRFDHESKNRKIWVDRWVHFAEADPSATEIMDADREGGRRPIPGWVGPNGNTEGMTGASL